MLSAVRVSKDGTASQRDGQILPVVEEDGEGGSGNGSLRDEMMGDGLRTPQKNIDGRGSMDSRDGHVGGSGGKTPVSRCSLDKQLPPLPGSGMGMVQESGPSRGSVGGGKERERSREKSPERWTRSPKALVPS